jgi:thiosulfate/3-mercaptopyruvate sulfurtransferase
MGGAIFVDYRATAYFLGISRLEGIGRYGTIPNAKNLPADWFTSDAGGKLRPRDQLRKLYELREIPHGLPHIAFSNTNERAALGWFVATEILGNKNVQLYEASIREWAANPKNRMHRQINLDE